MILLRIKAPLIFFRMKKIFTISDLILKRKLVGVLEEEIIGSILDMVLKEDLYSGDLVQDLIVKNSGEYY